MRNTLLISCLFFALTGYVRAQDMIFMISTPSCGDDGTIEIIIDSNQLDPDYQFPFDLNYKNIDTKETSSATITDFHHVIDYLKQGNYEVTIDLSDICEYRQVIKVESSITIYPNYINPSCDTDGEVNISVYGGTPGYTYHWSNGSNGQDLINVEAGSYTVTVTDRYDCIASMEFDIESTMPAILYASRNNCSVNESGGVIMIMRPNSGIIYEWDDPTIIPTDIDIVFFSFHKIENLENGVYCVTATDSNTGCKITECIEIVTEGGFDIIDVQVKEPCVSIPDGSISFDILKDFDNGNLFSIPTINWSDGVEYNGLMQREDLEQGDYNVTVQSDCQTEVINFSLVSCNNGINDKLKNRNQAPNNITHLELIHKINNDSLSDIDYAIEFMDVFNNAMANGEIDYMNYEFGGGLNSLLKDGVVTQDVLLSLFRGVDARNEAAEQVYLDFLINDYQFRNENFAVKTQKITWKYLILLNMRSYESLELCLELAGDTNIRSVTLDYVNAYGFSLNTLGQECITTQLNSVNNLSIGDFITTCLDNAPQLDNPDGPTVGKQWNQFVIPKLREAFNNGDYSLSKYKEYFNWF